MRDIPALTVNTLTKQISNQTKKQTSKQTSKLLTITYVEDLMQIHADLMISIPLIFFF